MTPLAVRQAVGEPEFIGSNGVWMYTHEEKNWVGSVTRGDVFLQFENKRLFHWQVTKPVCCERKDAIDMFPVHTHPDARDASLRWPHTDLAHPHRDYPHRD
jgi:hypothetical protein